MELGLALVAPTIILFVAMITDLRMHKIYNNWVFLSIIIALCNSYYFFGLIGVRDGSVAAAVALIMTLPLVLLGALGPGDMKLLFAFSLTSRYGDIFAVTIFSFIWAAIIGILISVWRKHRGASVPAPAHGHIDRGPSKEPAQKIPYSVALFLAWLTVLFLGFKQGAF